MSGFLKSVFKLLGLGRARHLVGYDLERNAYYELPNAFGSTDPRHTRRMIQYSKNKSMGDHIMDQKRLPVQWTLWLRHTRQDPPTIEELQRDVQRIAVTQRNARILEAKYVEEQERRNALRQAEHGSAIALLGGVAPVSEEASRASMRIQPSSAPQGSSSSAAGFAPRPSARRVATVPTSFVSDKEADAERDSRVLSEQELAQGSVRQERIPDNDVWAAARQRIRAQDGAQATSAQPAPTAGGESLYSEAKALRALRRQGQARDTAEKARARQEMGKSVLSAFDVDVQDEVDGVPSARFEPRARHS
ncbi:hypothetical protein K437DRAFT_257505 [Tilletiaria anomala UBC 951]|uniref:NADH dehydrogenase [ubiquinone] 1 alpha subcomplex subunit n=1 Tax=Tilletiaria anomala (strain ATCC 24038 / CBS 436.72 / UBC 951) TaxID=1037660 RepID=A0A066VSQ1_TILAU|nr:uncharacterized protein K437DRAFT_257505 [Tilletiaria anomala UBC 951]KDN43303.1 hypothetical protein K437DRAFT_257505 [Tilletiaria anomala UBC 951]